MADGTFTFAHKVGDRVQFKDGKNTRTGFVISQEPAEGDCPNGYTVMFKVKETGQNRLVRWAASDLQAAPEQDTYAFKKGDKVVVVDASGDQGQAGEVFERNATTQDLLEPSYAVLFKDDNGRTGLAWWGESSLSAAA